MLAKHSKQFKSLHHFALSSFLCSASNVVSQVLNIVFVFNHPNIGINSLIMTSMFNLFNHQKIIQKKNIFIKISILISRLCVIQLLCGDNKEQNVQHAIDEIRKAVAKYRPRVVALPECFNAPYGEEFFAKYAEFVPEGPTCAAMSAIAKELNIYLVGGSIPERDSDDSKKLYNTATVWSPNGQMIAKHRKVI